MGIGQLNQSPTSIRVWISALIVSALCLMATLQSAEILTIHRLFSTIVSGGPRSIPIDPPDAFLWLLTFIPSAVAAWIMLEPTLRHQPLSMRAGLTFAMACVLSGTAGFAAFWCWPWVVPTLLVIHLGFILIAWRINAAAARRRTEAQVPGGNSGIADDSGPGAHSRPPRIPERAMMALTLFIVASASLLVIRDLRAIPRGWADAHLFWLPRASAMASGQIAQVYFGHISHTDYPPLWPALIARVWIATQDANPIVPQLFTLGLFWGLLGVAYGALCRERGRIIACVGVIAIVSGDVLVSIVGFLTADLPLAFYLLAAFVTMRQWPLLSGLLLGCAAATKNEGIMMAAVTATSVAVLDRTRFVPLLKGILLLVIPVVLIKWMGAANDYLQSEARLQIDVLDFRRYELIGGFVWRYLIKPSHAVIWLVLLLALVRGSRPRAAPAVAVLLMLLAFWTIYVISPFPLVWHLNTSLFRLAAQIWPSAVYVLLSAETVPPVPSPAVGR